MMEPLTERLIFSGVLHDFLSNDTTPERSKRRDLCTSKSSYVLNDFFVKFIYFNDSFFFHCFALLVDSFDNSYELVSIFSRVQLR